MTRTNAASLDTLDLMALKRQLGSIDILPELKPGERTLTMEQSQHRKSLLLFLLMTELLTVAIAPTCSIQVSKKLEWPQPVTQYMDSQQLWTTLAEPMQ